MRGRVYATNIPNCLHASSGHSAVYLNLRAVQQPIRSIILQSVIILQPIQTASCPSANKMIQLEFSHCWIVKVGWMEEICCVFAKLSQRTKHIPIAGIFHAKTQKLCHHVFTLHLIFIDQNVSNASRFERTQAPVLSF